MDATLQDIIALARSGALEGAYDSYLRLIERGDPPNEDFLSLGGRLIKDRALEAQSAEARRALFAQAADTYAAAYARFGGPYSGINTATLRWMAGAREAARALAGKLLAEMPTVPPAGRQARYYAFATQAECLLLLGRPDEAEHALSQAFRAAPEDYAAQASTLRQFDMVLADQGVRAAWLDRFRPPRPAHFAGHLLGDAAWCRENGVDLAALQADIADAVAETRIGTAYGALAAGADILIAEAVLERGGQVQIVLPCEEEAFVDSSVRPFGEDWMARYRACRSGAVGLRTATLNPEGDDWFDRALASRLAMGLAITQARQWQTHPVQILVWDGSPPRRLGGTAQDREVWAAAGHAQRVLPLRQDRGPVMSTPAPADGPEEPRALMAILCADVAGFGRLSDRQTARFIDHVFRPLAACCSALAHRPAFINSWGDGLFLAFDAVEAAAEAALALQARFAALDLAAAGLPAHLGLRIGGHFGPAYRTQDPFLQREAVIGTQVTLATRIERSAAPGAVAVSEAFAAALALSPAAEAYRCEYLGPKDLEKDSGCWPLYSLRPVGRPVPALTAASA